MGKSCLAISLSLSWVYLILVHISNINPTLHEAVIELMVSTRSAQHTLKRQNSITCHIQEDKKKHL